jgi:hypothetical protein
MLIFNTSWGSVAHSLSEELLRMCYVFASFYFHFYKRQSNGSIPIRRQCQPRRSAPMHFLPNFSIGQNQCPPEQDLWVSTTHG